MRLPRPKNLPLRIPKWVWQWLKWRSSKVVPKPKPAPIPAPPAPKTAQGIDYAWQHPAPAAIKKAGYSFVLRYFSTDFSKNLTLTEAKALHAAGLKVGVVWESTATRALDGYLAGKKDAQAALAQLKSVGAPANAPIYFALDFDLKDYAPLLPNFPVFAAKKLGPVAHYFAGVLSVLPVARVGGYGGYWAIRRLFDAKLISYGWQTIAWSGGQWDSRAQLRQTGGAAVGGVKVDVNKALSSSFGVW